MTRPVGADGYSSKFVTVAVTCVAGVCPCMESRVAFAGFATRPVKPQDSAHLRLTTMGVVVSANFAFRSANVILTKLNEPLVRPLPFRVTLVFAIFV